MAKGLLAQSSAQDIADILWAFATVELRHEDLFSGIVQRLRDTELLQEFEGPDIVNVAWALAALGIRHEDVMANLAERLHDQEIQQSLSVQQMNNAAWAFKTLSVPFESDGVNAAPDTENSARRDPGLAADFEQWQRETQGEQDVDLSQDVEEEEGAAWTGQASQGWEEENEEPAGQYANQDTALDLQAQLEAEIAEQERLMQQEDGRGAGQG